VIAACP